MRIKQFLKPNWGKVVLFLLLTVIGILKSIPLNVIEITGAACPPHIEQSLTIYATCMRTVILYQNILFNFICYYIFSSIIICGWNKLRKKIFVDILDKERK